MAEAADPRAELERSIWQVTEWRGSAEAVEKLLLAADRYADQVAEGAVRRSRALDQLLRDEQAGLSAQEHLEEAQGGSAEAEPAGGAEPVADWSRGAHEGPPGGWLPSEGKHCNECARWKPWGEYHVDRSRTDERRSKCKDCCNRRLREKKRDEKLAAQAARRPGVA